MIRVKVIKPEFPLTIGQFLNLEDAEAQRLIHIGVAEFVSAFGAKATGPKENKAIAPEDNKATEETVTSKRPKKS